MKRYTADEILNWMEDMYRTGDHHAVTVRYDRETMEWRTPKTTRELKNSHSYTRSHANLREALSWCIDHKNRRMKNDKH